MTDRSAPRFRYQLLIFTLTRLVLNTGTRMFYPFLSTFTRGLGVDLAAMSAALSIRSLAGAISPFISPLADRKGRKLSMLLGLGTFAAGAGLMTLFPGFPAFVAALSLGFLGMFVFMSAMQAYVADTTPFDRRALALSISEMGWSLSFIFGMPVIGALLQYFDWTAPFPFLLGLTVVMMALVVIFVPNTRPPGSDEERQRSSFKVVLASPAALAGLAVCLCMVAANETITVVFGLWMEDAFGLQLAALGFASAVIGLAELGGESSGAALVDRLGKRRAVYGGLCLVTTMVLILPWMKFNLYAALAALFIFYLSFEFTFMGILPVMTELLPAARGAVMGAMVASFSLGRMFGDLLSPWIYRFGFRANTLAAAALILLAAYAFSRIKVKSD